MHEIVSGKSYDELDALIEAAQAEKEIAKEQALTELTAIAESFKVKCEALKVNPRSYFTEKKEWPDRYVNPANPDEKWNGRGPRPEWLKALLKGVDKKDQKEAIKQYLIG